MDRSASRGFSANEKEIESLLKQNNVWKENLAYISEEINFFIRFLTADIFRNNILNLYERLQLLYDELQDHKKENMMLLKELHNHRNDIEGILECEDISCEVFYHDEHLKLGKKVTGFSEKFKKFKLELYSFTGSNLRKASKEH